MQSGVLQSIRCAAHHLHNFKLKDLKNNKRDLKPEKRKKKKKIRLGQLLSLDSVNSEIKTYKHCKLLHWPKKQTIQVHNLNCPHWHFHLLD